MSAGKSGHPNEDHVAELKRLMKLDWVKRGLAIEFDVRTNFDIPYVGGVSKDGRTIYIDRKAYPALKKLGLVAGLVRHEQVEGVLMRHGYSYAGAHEIATAAEDAVYRSLKMDVKKAQSQYARFIRAGSKEDLQKVPSDLSLKPYEQSDDAALIKRMRLVMTSATKEAA